MREADVVVVGLGAVGGLAAARLALAGADVVGLEAGRGYGVEEFAPDQLRTDVRGWLMSGKARAECPTVRESPDEIARRPGFAGLTMNALGGTKNHSGCGSVRLAPWNFRSRSETLRRYGPGAIPAGSTLADWPVDYDELAPYYDRVEDLYGISGQAGNLAGQIDPRGNPFEGPRSGPYPLPPLRRSGYIDLMDGAARSLGWHPYPAPAAIRSQPYRGLPGCTYCGHCVFNGCWANAKGLSSLTGIPEAQASGRLDVVSHARVVEVLTHPDGRAAGVAYLKDGRRHVVRARVVVLGAYTYENVRLLLLSRSAAHPAGLANASGQVGRHFATHAFGFSFGSFGGRELNTWTGTMSQAVTVDDFNADNFDHTGHGFVGGGTMIAMMEKKLLLFSRMAPPSVARWGADFKRWLARDFRSVGHVHYFVDELPHEDSYLDLDPTHTDPDGLPVIRVTRASRPEDVAQMQFVAERSQEWLRAAGAGETWALPFHAFNVSAHAFGGARMGDDPATSVVDRFGMAHEVPNLALLGGSTFPTSTGSPPTETMEALAWRTADHIGERWSQLAKA